MCSTCDTTTKVPDKAENKSICDDFINGVSTSELMKKYGVSRNTILRRLKESGNQVVIDMIDKNNKQKRKSYIDSIKVCEEYLKVSSTTRTLAKQFNCSRKVISKILNESKDKRVINKLKYNGEKRKEYVFVESDIIYVVAKNSKIRFEFDYSEDLLKFLRKHTWFEVDNGHLYSNVRDKPYHACWYIIGVPEEGHIVDHIDRNPKNNRRNNLRFATSGENRINAKINSNNTTGYKGVSYREKTDRYRAYIWHNGKMIELGAYGTPEEAYEVRAKKELELYGAFANIHPSFKHLEEEVFSQ